MNSIVRLAQPMILIKEHEPIVLAHDDPTTAPRDERNVIGNGRFENAGHEFERLVPWGILYDQPQQHIELQKYAAGFAALVPRHLSLYQSINSEPFKTALKFRVSFKAKAHIEFTTEESRHTEVRWKFTFQTDTKEGGNLMMDNQPCGNGWTEFSLDYERYGDTSPIVRSWFFIGVLPNNEPHPTDPKGIWVTDINVIPLD